MANAGQRQRQKAAKAARRKAVVAIKKKTEAASHSMAERVRQAAACPIEFCRMSERQFEDGIGNVVIARKLPTGLLACGFFLVDTYCLGVKDAFFVERTADEIQDILDTQAEVQTFVDVAPGKARKLLNAAADYAAGIGLSAAKDYRTIEAIFGDAEACDETFAFGRDGKPTYVPGPDDTPARIRSIGNLLQNRLGNGGWSYLGMAEE